jgi:hypothetical protein
VSRGYHPVINSLEGVCCAWISYYHPVITAPSRRYYLVVNSLEREYHPIINSLEQEVH